MTVKQAIQSFPGLVDADTFIDKILVDRAIDGSADYTLALKDSVGLAAADCYSFLIANPDFSEGRFSVKLSRMQMVGLARKLYLAGGETANASNLEIGKSVSRGNLW